MKSIQKKSSKRRIIIASAIIAILLAIGAAVYFFHINNSATDTMLSAPTDDQIQAGEDSKASTIDSDDKGATSGSDRPSPSTEKDDSGKQVVSSQITASSIDGSIYRVRTLIQTVTTDGTCTITIVGPNSTFTKTSPVQALPNGSTCAGFDINISELKLGKMKVEIKFENATTTSTATTEVTL